MIRRNRDFLILAVLSAAAAAAAALLFGVGAGLLCLVPVIGCCLFTWIRYRRIRRLSHDLDRLLHEDVALPMERYTEGELSVLSSQLQKMILRLQESAETSSHDRQFLADSMADISHQLRTPLTSMNLTAAMLSEQDITPQRRAELIMELKSLLSRTDWLVQTLLKLSKLDAGTVNMVPQQMPVRDLLKRSFEPLSIPMELREQTLAVTCGDETVSVDPTWTAEALGNILKNCMEHTPNGGCVRVDVSQTPLFTQIGITDSGPGFDEKDIPRLFERFYKGKNNASGYGIGLSLARTVVTAQNGTIRASNVPGGACFTVKFYHRIL